MLDVIAKSKKHKFERQQEKDQMLNEFEKFDEQFKQIRKLTAGLERSAGKSNDFKVRSTNLIIFAKIFLFPASSESTLKIV